MGEAKRYLILSFLIFRLSSSPSSPATFPDDFSTMQKLANLLTPTPQGWLSSTDPCGNTKWSGVVCSSGRVVSINIASQSISGSLPSDLNKLTALKSLSLQKNTLSGSLPSLANLINLQEIYLDGNQFSSIPPTFFDNLPSLQSVSLDGNPLLPWSIPDLSQSTPLALFYASNANVVGPIPDFFGSLPSLQSLRLSYNNITGGLPHTFATSGLKNLWLNNQKSTTKLEGPIDVLGSMTHLSQVWLHTNSFTGPVPDLSNCTSLFDLQIQDNCLTGVLPQSIFTLPSLVNVSLGNNNLQGPFPSFASAVKVDNAITNNNFCNANGGPCDPRVTTLLLVAAGFGYPETLSDPWTGDDPCGGWSFVSCDSQGNVIVLNLAKQNLVGSISPAITNLTSLTTLILSNNKLTGPIPNGLAGLSQLQTVDLSNNNLTGKVPVFNPSVKLNTTGNPLLGSNSTVGGGGVSSGGSGSSASSPDGSPGGKSTSSFSVVLIVGIVLGVLLLIFIFWKRTKTRHSNANVSAIGSMVFSINDLRLATNNFSEDNIVGKGGFGVVYKGVLHDGSQVAVKRMKSSMISSRGTSSFLAEIAVLTRVRHRHLVGLKGYCTDVDEKLLVYEYMPQGTLGQHLFEVENHGYEILSWKQRLTIALDVARGIEYLHSLARQSFIHRDLKPSNILLGDDMRAKVSDFGLVKLVPDGKSSMETRLAGTFGYLAPEYAATGKVTTKADIYSFGVVLMEMITGRKVADDAQPEEEVDLVTWFRRVLIGKADMKINDIVDPTIKPDEDEDEATFRSILNVAELAGHCTARDPNQRPEMGNVVNILSPMVEQWKPASPDDEDGYDADGGGGGPYTHMTSLGSTQAA
ncbi:receptor-like kinase TMK4 [Magnolia sinica]|uniref:receptor-like kinase TMK4 n=1 Tax=Magnolia sinica TaxID=86752 RepID=UPI00265B58BA|nr:receptor-like kinase TMK4 [Magnolia sinica]